MFDDRVIARNASTYMYTQTDYAIERNIKMKNEMKKTTTSKIIIICNIKGNISAG